MNTAIHLQLKAIISEIHAVSDRTAAMTSLSADQSFHARPYPGAWSASDCIQHLSLTTRAYLPLIDPLLRAGGSPFTGRYRRDLLGTLLCWAIEPPPRMKSKTGAAFVPSGEMAKETIMGEFAALQRELEYRIEKANGLNLNRLRIVSPFNQRVTYNLYSGFRILLAHQRRHLFQAEQATLLLSRGAAAFL